MTDQDLMASIFRAWQPTIESSAAGVPPELVAAIIANESGGNEFATRFEPAVFAELCEVLTGRRMLYSPPGIKNPLAACDLLAFVAPQLSGKPTVIGMPDDLSVLFRQCLGRAAELATSYSLTQIMGWHWLEFKRPASMRAGDQLAFTTDLLRYFASRYTLDLANDAAKLLDCWNTGLPGGHTYDPQYIPRGLARLAIYRSLLSGETQT